MPMAMPAESPANQERELAEIEHQLQIEKEKLENEYATRKQELMQKIMKAQQENQYLLIEHNQQMKYMQQQSDMLNSRYEYIKKVEKESF